MPITPEQARAELARRELARRGVPLEKPQGMIRKGWDLLGKPEQMSRQGLNRLAGMVPNPEPTGNKLKDLAKGTPRIIADTMAQAAPGFVSRGALLTAGAMPVLRGVGKVAEMVGPGIADQLESLSGMQPGLLTKAFKDATLFFSRIPQEARDAYNASSKLAQKTSEEVASTPRPLALVMKLLKKVDSGLATQDEALAGRQAVDQLWDSKAITENFKNMARGKFDRIAKTAEDIKEADTAFSRGKQAAGLRQLFPQNKYGGTSAFKTGIMALLNSMGPAGKVGMAAMSPAAMGLGATGLGAVSRPLGALANNPGLAVVIQQLINDLSRGNTPQQPQGSGLQ